MQWTVLSMGSKNAGSQFRRMMEGVLQGLPNVDVYLDDVLIGFGGKFLGGVDLQPSAGCGKVFGTLGQKQNGL